MFKQYNFNIRFNENLQIHAKYTYTVWSFICALLYKANSNFYRMNLQVLH